MPMLPQNLRLGTRALRRTPGFTLTATLILALGIGLSTAVFTIADALLLRKLAVRDQDALVVLAGATPDGRVENYPLSLESARELARRSRTLEATAFYGYEGAVPKPVLEGDQVTRLHRALVSGDFFSVLGTPPALGRALRPEDDRPGAAPVVVLSHRAWQARFGGSPDVLDRRIRMQDDGIDYRVVGVMPQGLEYPKGVDVWAPVLAATPERNLPFVAVHLLGRLRDGAVPASAAEEVSAFFRTEAPAQLRELRGTAVRLPDLVVGDTRPVVLLFAAAAGLLLLVTCVNVANLLVMRGLARQREIAVRFALGATRARVVGAMLAEYGMLAIAAGVLGVGVAAAAVRGFVAFAPPGLPRLDEIGLNATALAGATVITLLAMLLFAVAPAMLSSSVKLHATLSAGARGSRGRKSRFASETLVAGQLALALLVLSGAGLIGRSLQALQRAELAFSPTNLLIGELAIRADQYDTPAKQRAMLDQLLPAVASIPGVRAVSPVVAAPYSGTAGWDGSPRAEGQSASDAARNPLLNMEVVTPGYFETIEVKVTRGRGFTPQDREGAPAVVVVSESAAQHYWPNADPIGRRLAMGPNNTFTVVGVVPETRYRDLRNARASIYFPLQQSFFPFTPTTLAIRTGGDPSAVVPSLRRAITETVPGVLLASAAPFEDYLSKPLAQPRLTALLLAVFAGAALVLASVGLFAVMGTMVGQRRREFGVRMALGATAGQVGVMVLRRGLALAAVGTVVGVASAIAANRLLGSLLFEVSPTDAVTLAGSAILLLAVAALASVLPARASTRIDPAITLRAE
ncbi:MAG: ABC transporter permease [Gemmatimonadota bacterium]